MERLYRLTAFPLTETGGNKAGVYIDADLLSDEQMQDIAKQVGYSETAFVMKSRKADFKVRFFTPQNEVNLCGHATIATFNLLRDLNIITTGLYTQETKAGVLQLNVTDDMVFMQQPLPIFSEHVSIKELRKCFVDLPLHGSLKPQVVSTGLREIFLPVKNQDALNNLIPIHEKIIEISQKYDLIGIHAFCLDNEVDAYGRNFAPAVGIKEESATGTSNGALACYLFKYVAKKTSYVLRQGFSMGLPSEIKANLEYDEMISTVWVGGSALQINQ